MSERRVRGLARQVEEIMGEERDGADSAMEEAARLSLELEEVERYAEKLLGVIQCCNANTKRRDAKLERVREWALSEYDATKAPSKDFTLGYLSAGMQVLAILDGADAPAPQPGTEGEG